MGASGMWSKAWPMVLLLALPALPAAAASSQAYAVALDQAVKRNWLRPDTIAAGSRCPVRVRQSRGGRIDEVDVLPGCGFDQAGRASVLRAVQRASPLPYAGYEDVFEPELRLVFQADGAGS